MDSTKPASRSTRRCLDTIGCGMPSCRSISPTDCCDETSRLNIARRFGSAMISKTDSTPFIYSREHIRVKVYSEVTFVAPSCTSAANTIIVILKWTRREQGCRRASVDSAESKTVQSIVIDHLNPSFLNFNRKNK